LLNFFASLPQLALWWLRSLKPAKRNQFVLSKVLLKQLKMVHKKQILKATKVLPMSKSTKEKIASIAKDIKGKELFPEKVDLAKKTLSKLKSLPI
jgi:hypothetical protein